MELNRVVVLCKSNSGKHIVSFWQKFPAISPDRNVETCYLFLLGHTMRNKRKELVYFDHQNVIFFASTIISSTACASFVFLLRYRNKVFSQSGCIFSGDYLLTFYYY